MGATTVQHIQHLAGSEVKGKTEQRVVTAIEFLKAAKAPVTYQDLRDVTGAAYDVMLYVMSTLVVLGFVERIDEEGPKGPGRPVVKFTWVGEAARDRGSRRAA